MSSTPAATEPALPLDWVLPSGLPAVPPPVRRLRLVPGSEAPAANGSVRSIRAVDPGEPPLPAAAPWVARLAPAILEVVAGERPAGQLTRWVTAEIRETLGRRGAAALRHPAGKGRPPQCRRVRSVRVTEPAPGVVEASAVVVGGVRARAVAIRLEVVRGRWLATAVELG